MVDQSQSQVGPPMDEKYGSGRLSSRFCMDIIVLDPIEVGILVAKLCVNLGEDIHLGTVGEILTE